MKKIKATKENIALVLITILSAVLNLWNLSIEGTANSYYAAAVKSMTMSFKNFFFVSFDPAGFVTIDKPPLGFWLQAISAKIFGYSGWSIILPQALAGVISVVLIYHIVKRSFGSAAGLISALALAITPVFVAVSRNNSVDNTLVMVLLLACWALTVAAEKGKLKYLIASMILVGVGFNIKMLQAYMIAPALYITYLLSTATSIKKRIINLIVSTFILIAVSLSWAVVVDLVPASNRPYVDSSTNNTVMELIVGHNGLERVSLSNSSDGNGGPGGGAGRKGQRPSMPQGNSNSSSGTTNNQSGNTTNSTQNNQGGNNSSSNNQGADSNAQDDNGHMGPGGNGQFTPPSGGMAAGGNMQGGGGMGGSSGLQGSFGGQTTSSITRLFSKNILSDQIVWFIPLAIFGFLAAAIKEKLSFKLDNDKKQQLVLWGMWFLPVFVYFSFNTGTFHPYYLTMLAPPTAALAGIGITYMWKMHKEGGWKSWFLPIALLANGLAQMLMLYYFVDTSSIIKILAALVIVLCLGSSIVLLILNLMNIGKKELEDEASSKKHSKVLKLKKVLVSLAVAGLMVTPFVGSAATLAYPVNNSFPAAGLELLSGSSSGEGMMGKGMENSKDSSLVSFLEKNKTANQKYLLVVANANSASEIIIQTGEPVMAIGGFLGNDKSITLDKFKELVKKGEIRYVMTGGMGGGGNSSASSEIMSWVQQNGTVVSSSEYSSSTDENAPIDNNSTADQSSNSKASSENNSSSSTKYDQTNQRDGGFGRNSGTLYDLKAYTDSLSSK